jgi:transporter family-2 protein
MKFLLLMFLAMLTGCLIPVQSIINGRLGTTLANPLLAALISFTTGTILLALVILAVPGGIPPWRSLMNVPWILYVGGSMGAVFVTLTILLIPEIGPANVVAAAIVGQLGVALLLDHWGVLGIQQRPITWIRVLGALLLIVGTWLIQDRH